MGSWVMEAIDLDAAETASARESFLRLTLEKQISD
jgi:hypothetical protein